MGNQATSLNPQVLDDLAENTNFTADEIREYYRKFMRDTGTGRMTLSEEEFREAYNQIFPSGDAEKFAKQVFQTCDKDGDGKLDFREFLSSISVQQRGTFQEKLVWAFDLYDIDNSGRISKSELVEMIKSFRQLKSKPIAPSMLRIKPDDLAAYIIEKADTNNDWELSKEEFIAAAQTSKTLQAMVIGSMEATGSPFVKRKGLPK